MSYTSIQYYMMAIILVVAYYLFPKRLRWLTLLGGSVFFYANIISEKKQFAVFLLTIASSYCAAIACEKLRGSNSSALRKTVMWGGVIITALPLLLEKIGGFVLHSVFRRTGISLIIPVGLSFYTLQMIAYIVDVYKGKIKAQRNPLKYMLFASFFPQIIQGPIPRYDKLNQDLFDGNDYDFKNIISGTQLVIWGFFLKYMIADKSAVIVDHVFDNYRVYSGGYILLAAVLYSIQLYADFLSCTTMSQGVSELFGIHLGDNFNHPYFSTSIKEFWGRWHISLSLWLRDYIYIPLGGNRKGKIRKWIHLFITFFISGLWHGSGWNFIAWGILHAVYQIAAEIRDIFLSRSKRIMSTINDPTSLSLRRITTFFLVMIAWIFFRAVSFRAAIAMIYSMITDFNPWVWFDDSLFGLGLGWKEYVVLVLSIFVLYWVSRKQEKGINVREFISNQNIIIRWGIYLIAIWAVWIFGTYGYGFDAKDFIYGGF